MPGTGTSPADSLENNEGIYSRDETWEKMDVSDSLQLIQRRDIGVKGTVPVPGMADASTVP